ncbi:peptidyl-prolyl cis-trans isomerase [Bacteroidia bacterium]|nr:peptidyl-prolyl cis-trans isomerase [Bacteroidia bacterium]
MNTMKLLLPVIAALLLPGGQACGHQQECQVVIETSLGEIVAVVYPEQAPITAKNFLRLVDLQLYNKGASFYRVTRNDNQPNQTVKIDVIQGGLRGTGANKLQPIVHETTQTTGLSHLDGTLSMARGKPGTATSDFFICIGNQPELDFGGRRNPDGTGFAAFGSVIKGMDVVRTIQQLQDEKQYLLEPVKIISIRRMQ